VNGPLWFLSSFPCSHPHVPLTTLSACVFVASFPSQSSHHPCSGAAVDLSLPPQHPLRLIFLCSMRGAYILVRAPTARQRRPFRPEAPVIYTRMTRGPTISHLTSVPQPPHQSFAFPPRGSLHSSPLCLRIRAVGSCATHVQREVRNVCIMRPALPCDTSAPFNMCPL